MDAPTAEDIREWSKLDWEDWEYPEPDGSDPDPLTVLVTRAIEYVEATTGRKVDATMPSELDSTAGEAVQRRVEQLAIQSQDDYVETGADFDQISAWNVTGYSETRRSADDYNKAKLINPWPHLHELLWLLATEDKRDEWRETWGIQTPAFAVSEVEWDNSYLNNPSITWPGA